ncbi:hypothetical protein HanXRQr2_Chr14g0653191 [Helianthus annuus]|uniref:Uncharacterized protein n=1 Tax=Helianthus annuus TaxID=4232 RepID=A0A251SIU1_HELAN|nr:hypothetical protein HanXRQr2_Chr14g0653191 [Helianthus annuus]
MSMRFWCHLLYEEVSVWGPCKNVYPFDYMLNSILFRVMIGYIIRVLGVWFRFNSVWIYLLIFIIFVYILHSCFHIG